MLSQKVTGNAFIAIDHVHRVGPPAIHRYLRVLPADNPTCFGSLGSLALARATKRSVMLMAVMSFSGPQERLASNRQSETQLTVGQLWSDSWSICLEFLTAKTLNTLKDQVSKPFCNINTKSQHTSGKPQL